MDKRLPLRFISIPFEYLISARAAGARLGISRQAIRVAIHRGKLSVWQPEFCRSFLVDAREVAAYKVYPGNQYAGRCSAAAKAGKPKPDK